MKHCPILLYSKNSLQLYKIGRRRRCCLINCKNDIGNESVKKMISVNVKKILLFEARDKLRTEENNYEFAQVLEF